MSTKNGTSLVLAFILSGGGEGRMDGNWIIQTGVKILQPVASESEVVTSSS